MDNKFLDKVVGQILSETRIIDGKIHTPFSSFSPSLSLLFSLHTLFLFRLSIHLSKHCKDVYSLTEQEIEYVWKKYKEELTTLMVKKELV